MIRDRRNEIRETKMKCSFFGFCTMNQLTGLYSNRGICLSYKTESLLQKEGENWDFLVVFFFDVVIPYCITSLTVAMVPTSWFPALFGELGVYSLALTFDLCHHWTLDSNLTYMLGVCTLPTMLCLWYSCMYPAKVKKKQKTSGYFPRKGLRHVNRRCRS